MDLLTSLNPEQRMAVQTIDGPVCIIAGPGTGKTKTLISRLFFMIQEHRIDPSAILAVTFTRKAAAEMNDRLLTLLPSGSRLPVITTFHGLGYRLLGRSCANGLRVIDDSIRVDIISRLVSEQYPSLTRLPLRELLLRISRYKNMTGEEDDSLTPLIRAYCEELVTTGMMDYDDLLLETYRKMESDGGFLQGVRGLFSHILVDEFQDTNALQYAIIRRLLNKSHNLFVIGDPQQSIYSFRGANGTIFDSLLEDYPSCIRVTLTHNYRSTLEVLRASYSLFPEQSLTATVGQEGSVFCVRTLNEYTEADWIVGEISRKMGGMDLLQVNLTHGQEDQSACFSDFAVLYRTHTVAKTLIKRFEESGIPFQTVGAVTIYERPEIACIIAVLMYLDDRTPDRLLNIYAQRRVRIPKATLKELVSGRDIRHGKRTIQKVLQHLDEISGLSQRQISKLIDDIVERFSLRRYIEANADATTAYRQFYSSIIRFDGKEDGLKQCVLYLSQIGEREYYNPMADRVSLLTIHAAKGLEFPYVFICGFEDGLIPLTRDAEPSDEEKRLMFVAMTRAKKTVYLTETKTRFHRKTVPSRYKSAIITYVAEQEDEATERVEKRNKIRNLKKRQLSLF